MLSFLSRHRLALGVLLGLVLTATLLVQTVPFVHMGWDTLSGTPDLELVQDVRHELLSQSSFQKTLAGHEENAIERHHNGGASSHQHRHLVQVNLTPFGLPGFHDVFAVRVRTDIVDGNAYTSFLARPGLVFDPKDATFFSRQCESGACKTVIGVLVRTGRTLLDWGVLTPYRLNVTEMDETSSVSFGTEAISTAKWARKSRTLHQNEIGRAFTERATH